MLEQSENDSFLSNGHKAIVAKLCLDGPYRDVNSLDSTSPPGSENALITRLQLLAHPSVLPPQVFILPDEVCHWQTSACQTGSRGSKASDNQLTDSIQIDDLLLEVGNCVIDVPLQ